ncbi:glutamine amidotransferase-related protein [Hyphomicrobium sp.]|uniref:glutamine amidotransferase-related protein n=1 Tax=Hyphomicrobium sp. TaxID=82 RepID=UPI002FE0105B
MRKLALAVRHVHFESLGTLERELADKGYTLRYFDVAVQDVAFIDPSDADLLVILGGPIRASHSDRYPFLARELSLIKARLKAHKPLLGIGLGAQLIAMALGSRVAPAGKAEIAFKTLALTDAGRTSVLHHLQDVPVLHWQWDAFEVPSQAQLLASTAAGHQAFSFASNVLALQFHLEAIPATTLSHG